MSPIGTERKSRDVWYKSVIRGGADPSPTWAEDRLGPSSDIRGRGLLLRNLMPTPFRLASRYSLASTGQESPTRPRGINQPALISCVCDGADELFPVQSNFQGFFLNPRICSRCTGVHSGGN
jgi:hypothetical protein